MPIESPIAIDVDQVSFRTEDLLILKDVSFTVPQGSYMGIIGPNGGGKTTLLKVILGLLMPTSGSVRIFGRPPEQARQQGRIGYVPQRVAQGELLFPSTVEEIVKSGRVPRVGMFRWSTREDAEAIEAAMERTGVLPLRKRLLSNLSGGERQKVFIARSLTSDPKILILDEPTTGVDIASKERFYALLRALNRDLCLTIIFVSHDIEVMTKEATSVCCLNQTLLCCCTSHQFLHNETLQKLYGENVSFLQHTH